MNAATDFLPASGLLAQLDLLLIEHAGAVTHLRLNRPAKRNAINEALMRQLHTALLNLPASTRALVVSGEGAHFCAGLDLSDLSERSVAEGVLHSRGWHVVMDALQFCSVPVVAALHGAVVGGGLELAAAVHIRVADETAYFGLAYNPESIIEQSSQFDFYDGGGLDCSFLGLAQTDRHGNVNVSKFNGRPVGCGGFINITASTPRLVFCGTFTAGGLELAVGDGRLTIIKEGRSRKFVEQVEQITFNGSDAAKRQQQVSFITERAVFVLQPDGLALTEIAPGVDLERDVLAHMGFRPLIRDLKLMDAALFQPHWGGLAAALTAA